MKSESSHKFYYRYPLGESWLSPSHHLRKIKKAARHSTTHLLIDLTKEEKLDALDLNFFANGHNFARHYLIRPDQAVELWLERNIAAADLYLHVETPEDLTLAEKNFSEHPLLCSPTTEGDLKGLLEQIQSRQIQNEIYWSFKPYNPLVRRGLTLKNIYQSRHPFRTLSGLELFNTQVPVHYELEALSEPVWSFRTPERSIEITVIIPSFNNVVFLSSVLRHLFAQSMAPQNFEIIVVEDGGRDGTAEIIRTLFAGFENQINLKMIHWSKSHPTQGEQNFFRAGLARNLGMHYCESEKVVFLDSDILTPTDFLTTATAELEKNDLIQFQRYHIHQSTSLTNPNYNSIRLHQDTYVEEESYWNQLFKTDNWMSLKHYWKYTCTYALGLRRSHFFEVGRFKKYYVSYGFEDTDLGYEFFKRGRPFKLIKMPLLHLTAYDRMQYKNSQVKRMKLLRKTAALFYLQHLDPEIYELFGNFYRFEKPLLRSLKDLF